MSENWRDVPGYEGLYQISVDTKEGRCRRIFKNSNIKELSNKPNKKDSYICWGLRKDGKRIFNQAAKWIALTYSELIENEYFEGAEIDHKDTDRHNNHPSNLIWVTRKENQNNPLTKKHMGTAQTNRSDQSKKVYQFTLEGEYVNAFPSVNEVYRQTGIYKSNISRSCNGKLNQTGGYVWRYA